MTLLKEYLRSRKVKTAELARTLNISRVHMSNIVNGKSPAGKDLAKKIEKWSNGVVDHDSLLYPAD